MASDIFPNARKQSGVLNLYMICHLPKVQRHTLNLRLFRKDRSTHRTDSRKQNTDGQKHNSKKCVDRSDAIIFLAPQVRETVASVDKSGQ